MEGRVPQGVSLGETFEMICQCYLLCTTWLGVIYCDRIAVRVERRCEG